MHAGELRLSDLAKVLSALALITLLIRSPLTFAWWQLIGDPR